MKSSYLFPVCILALIATFAGSASSKSPDGIIFAAETLKIQFPHPESLIQFFYVGLDDEKDIEVYVTIRCSTGISTEYVGRIGAEGGSPYIESVFMDNADDDPQKELFIIARWETRHRGLGTEGNYYKTYIYDDSINREIGFNRVTAMEEVIGSGLDGQQAGETVSYNYKNASSIRKLLRNLGY